MHFIRPLCLELLGWFLKDCSMTMMKISRLCFVVDDDPSKKDLFNLNHRSAEQLYVQSVRFASCDSWWEPSWQNSRLDTQMWPVWMLPHLRLKSCINLKSKTFKPSLFSSVFQLIWGLFLFLGQWRQSIGVWHFAKGSVLWLFDEHQKSEIWVVVITLPPARKALKENKHAAWRLLFFLNILLF